MQAWLCKPLHIPHGKRIMCATQVALSVGASVIGVNNRNLHTLVLDKNRTAAIAEDSKHSTTARVPVHVPHQLLLP